MEYDEGGNELNHLRLLLLILGHLLQWQQLLLLFLHLQELFLDDEEGGVLQEDPRISAQVHLEINRHPHPKSKSKRKILHLQVTRSPLVLAI